MPTAVAVAAAAVLTQQGKDMSINSDNNMLMLCHSLGYVDLILHPCDVSSCFISNAVTDSSLWPVNASSSHTVSMLACLHAFPISC
jgi:hypothetical protein